MLNRSPRGIIFDGSGIVDGGGLVVLEWYLSRATHHLDPRHTTFVLTDAPSVRAIVAKCQFEGQVHFIGRGKIRRLAMLTFGGGVPIFTWRASYVLVSLANVPTLWWRRRSVLILQQAKILDAAPSTWKTFAQRLILRLRIRGVDMIVVQTRHVATRLVHRFSVDPTRVISFANFPPLQCAGSQPLKPPPTENGWDVSYISLFRPHKNHVNLIRALKYLPDDVRIRLHLTISQAELRQLIKAYPDVGDVLSQAEIHNRIVLHGTVSHSDALHIIKGSHFTVFPSLVESLGLPLLESAKLGVPVIASNLPFAKEILGVEGVYFDPDCARSISKCILSMLDENLLRRRGLQLLQFIERREVMDRGAEERFFESLQTLALGGDIAASSTTEQSKLNCTGGKQ